MSAITEQLITGVDFIGLPTHDLGAAVEAERLPGGLRGAGARDHVPQAVGVKIGDVRDRLAGRGILDREGRRGGSAARPRLRSCFNCGHESS